MHPRFFKVRLSAPALYLLPSVGLWKYGIVLARQDYVSRRRRRYLWLRDYERGLSFHLHDRRNSVVGVAVSGCCNYVGWFSRYRFRLGGGGGSFFFRPSSKEEKQKSIHITRNIRHAYPALSNNRIPKAVNESKFCNLDLVQSTHLKQNGTYKQTPR